MFKISKPFGSVFKRNFEVFRRPAERSQVFSTKSLGKRIRSLLFDSNFWKRCYLDQIPLYLIQMDDSWCPEYGCIQVDSDLFQAIERQIPSAKIERFNLGGCRLRLLLTAGFLKQHLDSKEGSLVGNLPRQRSCYLGDPRRGMDLVLGLNLNLGDCLKLPRKILRKLLDRDLLQRLSSRFPEQSCLKSSLEISKSIFDGLPLVEDQIYARSGWDRYFDLDLSEKLSRQSSFKDLRTSLMESRILGLREGEMERTLIDRLISRLENLLEAVELCMAERDRLIKFFLWLRAFKGGEFDRLKFLLQIPNGAEDKEVFSCLESMIFSLLNDCPSHFFVVAPFRIRDLKFKLDNLMESHLGLFRDLGNKAKDIRRDVEKSDLLKIRQVLDLVYSREISNPSTFNECPKSYLLALRAHLRELQDLRSRMKSRENLKL